MLDAAEIKGPQATAKGGRHGFAVAMILGGMGYRLLQQRLGQEAHDMQMEVWERANKNWSK